MTTITIQHVPYNEAPVQLEVQLSDDHDIWQVKVHGPQVTEKWIEEADLLCVLADSIEVWNVDAETADICFLFTHYLWHHKGIIETFRNQGDDEDDDMYIQALLDETEYDSLEEYDDFVRNEVMDEILGKFEFVVG